MSNVIVTIIQSGRTDDWGLPLVAGNSYSLEFDRAKSLWQAGFASVADPTVFDDDNTPNAGGLIRYIRFPGFRRSLLASLVANSTASRTGGQVTVTATGHGITTGATYQGLRFFYPGSPSLVAGWYDSIISIPDANTLTFSAPGTDFAPESVNSAAAYTTNTDFCSALIPASWAKPYASFVVAAMWSGDTTATTKNQRVKVGATSFITKQTSTVPSIETTATVRFGDDMQTQFITAADNANTTNITKFSQDFRSDNLIGLSGNVAAAAGFLVLSGADIRGPY